MAKEAMEAELPDDDQRNAVDEEFASVLREVAGEAGEGFGDDDFYALADLVVRFSERICDIEFYPYQREAAMGIVFSILREDAEEISLLFSRQSGKSELVADIVVGLLVLLPILADAFPNEKKLSKFLGGIWVGIFAPNVDTASIMYQRVQTRLYTQVAKDILSDPEIDLALPMKTQKVGLPNGSRVDCNSAAPGAKIEGKTYHLIIIEESQDVSDAKILKCLSSDTLIYTLSGRLPLRDFKRVRPPIPQVTKLGNIATQEWYEFHDNGVQEGRLVSTSNGREVWASEGHRWLVRKRVGDRKPKEVLTRDLVVGDTVAVPDRWVVERTGKRTFGQGLMLGSILGDGCTSGGSAMFCGFTPLLEELDAVARKEWGVAWKETHRQPNGLREGFFTPKVRIGGANNPLIKWLRLQKVWGLKGSKKRFPESVFTESEAFQRGVVVGLIETDGSVVLGKKPHITFDNISKELVDDLADLLWQFGIHVSRSDRDNSGGFCPNAKRLWSLRIKGSEDVRRFAQEFKLISKQESLDVLISGSAKGPRHGKGRGVPPNMRFTRIKNIGEVERKSTACFTVPNETFLAGGLLSLNSIHPMGAAVASTMVKIGTPVPHSCEFEKACKRNKRKDMAVVKRRYAEIRNHYEFDYKIASLYNERYAKYMEKEIERLGEDSDEFRMSYKLHWLTERGRFLSDGLFESCAIRVKQTLEATVSLSGDRMRKVTTTFIRPSYPTTNDRFSYAQVAGIDFGKETNSTVVTVARVWWDNPIPFTTVEGEEQSRYYTHIQNWLELLGDDYDAQIPQIVLFLQNYDVCMAVCDSTGPGDPVTDFLAGALEEMDIAVEAFIFSTSSKDIGYKRLLQEMQAGRFTFPAGRRAERMRKWQKYRQQMTDLEKSWRGSRMVVERPKEKDAHDDYPDSAMMVVHGVVECGENQREVEVETNPFVGRKNKDTLFKFGKNKIRTGGIPIKDRLEWEQATRPVQKKRYRR